MNLHESKGALSARGNLLLGRPTLSFGPLHVVHGGGMAYEAGGFSAANGWAEDCCYSADCGVGFGWRGFGPSGGFAEGKCAGGGDCGGLY